MLHPCFFGGPGKTKSDWLEMEQYMEMMEEEGLYEIVYICKVVFVTVVSFLQEASCPVKALAPL